MNVLIQFWADAVPTTFLYIRLVDNTHYDVLFPNKSLFSMEPKVFGITCYVRDVLPSITK